MCIQEQKVRIIEIDGINSSRKFATRNARRHIASCSYPIWPSFGLSKRNVGADLSVRRR